MRHILKILGCGVSYAALTLPALAQTAVGGSRITDLPPASLPLSGTEAVNVVQGGVSKQTSVGQIEGNAFAPSCSTPGFFYFSGSGPIQCLPPISGVVTAPAGSTTTSFASDAAASMNFYQPDTHAIIRSMLAKNQDTVSVMDWIPVGTNLATTNVSTYFQNAATDACARSPNGLHIMIPAGSYIAHDINNTCGNLWEGAGPGGVGSANQTSVSSIVPGGTTINYSGATSYFMQWQVSGFPAFKSGAHINGGGLENVTLNDGSSSAWAMVSEGTQDWAAEHVVINGAYEGVYMKGDEFPVTSHISMYGTRLLNYQIVGDLSGQTASGAACTTSNGDCSTRNDVWYGEYLTNIDNLYTNRVFTITGFVATTTLSHTSGEGPLIGMDMSCPAGLNANMAMCPTFGRFNDIQFENFHQYGVKMTNSLNNYFDHLYSVGDATATATNSFYESTINYAASTVPPGVTQITNSQLFAAWGDCAYFAGTLWDIEIYNTRMNGCNTGNSGANVVNFAGTATHVKVGGNQLGNVDNYTGAFAPARGVVLSANTKWADVYDNNFDGLSASVSPVLSASSFPGTIHVHDNLGPGSTSPTIGACGTGAAFGNIAKDDEFIITVGTGSPTTCAVTFSNPMYAQPACVVSPAAGASATSLSLANDANGVTINGAALSGGYLVICRAP